MSGTPLRGRYHIIKKLGSGGFGETYLSEDWDLPGHPPCVVKRLQPTSNKPFVLQTAQRLFEKEAQVLQRLGSHEQIPRLLAHFQENQEFYLVEELIQGEDLSRELATGSRGAAKNSPYVTSLLLDILEVLAFVHQEQVIHRDIKPANLIRRVSDGKICLIDFGAVKEISSLSANSQGEVTTTVCIGTRGYMPDEQANGKPQYNSDVYAVGIIAIQALTGLDPNPKNGGLPADAATGEIRWRDKAQVSDALADIIDMMVRKDCRQRYPSAVEALQALQSLSNSPLNPTVPSPAPASPNSSGSSSQNFPSRSKRKKMSKVHNTISLVAGIIACIAAVIVVPEVRKFLNLDSDVSKNFLVYENPDSGIKMKYPASWSKPQVVSDKITGEYGVTFLSDTLPEQVSISVENFSARPISLDRYTQLVMEQIEQETGEKLSQPILSPLLDGGYQVVYTASEGQYTVQKMRLWKVQNLKAYLITYTAEKGKFSDFEKRAKELISFLEIR